MERETFRIVLHDFGGVFDGLQARRVDVGQLGSIFIDEALRSLTAEVVSRHSNVLCRNARHLPDAALFAPV